MLAGNTGQANDRVAMNAHQPSRGPDATAFIEVIEDGVGLLVRQMAAVERRALALGKPSTTGVAVKLAELLVLAVATADREVAGAPPSVVCTVLVLAAEASEIVHVMKGPDGQ